jgi:hypothetical protein
MSTVEVTEDKKAAKDDDDVCNGHQNGRHERNNNEVNVFSRECAGEGYRNGLIRLVSSDN